VISQALVLTFLAVTPAERFAASHAIGARVASHDGQRLLHASDFLSAPRGAGPVEAARAFLAAEGEAFGVAPEQELVLLGAPAAGRAGAVRFARRIAGFPVFGGDLVVGVDAENRVHAVNAGDVPPAASGGHAIGEERAVEAALASFPGGARGADPAVTAAGWRNLLGRLRAVYRVDFIAAEPPGDWRVTVDGETGATLFREDRRYRATAPGNVFEVSPVETASARCAPAGNGGLTFCAAPVPVTLQNLLASPPTTLTGTQATVYNCRGAEVPTSGIPGPCASVASVSSGFSFASDATFASASDDFSAAMAYHHLDRHASFFKALDPTLPGGALRALNGSLPGLVNAWQAGGPFENAFYSPLLDAMVFGQGVAADFAYDATVIYHELTHGVIEAWGGFTPDVDALGGLDEPGALHEGTADAMAASEVGRSFVGSYLGSSAPLRSTALRDLSDPGARRTCRGDGTVVRQLGTNAVNGLDGEVHDDGEIWNGFYWEVYQGLKGAGVKGCAGACEAAPAIQYHALQLAAGTSPTFATQWQTFKSAAAALFPANPAVASYVDCVARRRGMDRCDRTVPVYAGETKLAFVRLRWSPFQMAVQVTAPTATLQVCSVLGTSSTLHGRTGQPVALAAIDPTTLDATVTENGSTAFTQACSGGSGTITLQGPATWYLLFDSRDALVGGDPGLDIFRVIAGSGVAPRPVTVAPPTCTFGAPATLAIAPTSISVAAGSGVAFVASGGTPPYAWSLAASPSGGFIEVSRGIYTAGATGGTTDVVQLRDSVGAQVQASVTVTAPGGGGGGGGGGGSSSGCGCAGGDGGWLLVPAPLALLARRRARPGAALPPSP